MKPDKIIETFFSVHNPAIIVAALFIIISTIVFLIKKEFIKPLQKRKDKLEDENLRLLALFAELDPDPILRVDKNGIIITLNEPAKTIFTNAIVGQKCETIIANYKELLNNSKLSDEIVEVDKKYFTISIKENSTLEFVQIYLHDISKRIEQEKLIEEYQENLKILRLNLDYKNEKERMFIGQELHDNIGNQLSLCKLNLQNFIENPEAHNIDELYSKIDLLSEEVRRVSHQLSPKILTEFGLISALTQLIEETTKNSMMSGHIVNMNYEEIENNNLKLGIYRICQEALSNILKHSKCKEFEIQLVVEEGKLKIIISDNGVGYTNEKTRKPTLGLLNMEERTKSLNGVFELNSLENEGTTIYLEFYLNGENTND